MNRREFLGAVIAAATTAMLSGYVFSDSTKAAVKDFTRADFDKMRKSVPTSYGRIACIDQGQGDAALFLHGFPLNSFQWRGVIPRLSQLGRCIAPDLLGMGFTEVTEGSSLAPAAQAAMLAELLDRLSCRMVDIVANDSGGAVAQLFLARHPERVRTLLLTDCDTEPNSPPAAVLPIIESAKEGKYADQWLVPWLADKRLARSAKGIGGMCYSNPEHPTDEAIDCYLGPLVGSPGRIAMTNAYAVALAPNPLAGIEPALRRSRVPVRMLWGTDDGIFPLQDSEYLNRIFTNARGVRRVPGGRLFFPEERPEIVAEEAKRLWQRQRHGQPQE